MRGKRLTGRLDAIATMSLSELHGAWAEALGEPAPPLTIELLRGELAFRVQVKAHGDLPAAVGRLLSKPDDGTPPPRPSAAKPSVGTHLIREWQGRTISVVVADDGTFRWEGRPYGSLSRIARDVTGAHWSGPRFFGTAARG